MRRNYFIICILLINVTGGFSQADSSVWFNRQGYELYKSQKYAQAISLFQKAINNDESDFYAHYNLACTLAILTTKSSKCDINYYVKTIESLENCIALDSLKTILKAKSDKDFNGIRGEYEFNVLINGLDFSKDEYVKEFIVNKVYRTSAPGSSYYPVQELILYENYSWKLTYHKNGQEMFDYFSGTMKSDPPQIIYGTARGTWELKGHLLVMKDEKKKTILEVLLVNPERIDNFYYPDPNDMSGNIEVKHYWKSGKCGCGVIDGL